VVADLQSLTIVRDFVHLPRTTQLYKANRILIVFIVCQCWMVSSYLYRSLLINAYQVYWYEYDTIETCYDSGSRGVDHFQRGRQSPSSRCVDMVALRMYYITYSITIIL
jgi:hypothetical protein